MILTLSQFQLPRGFAVLGAVVLVSCSGPRVTMLDRPVSSTKTARALTNATALEDGTRATLRDEDLLSSYRMDADRAIRILTDRYLEQPTAARGLALAEMSSDQADLLTEDKPNAALGRYLDAAWLTRKGALAADGMTDESAEKTIYDYAAARVTRLIHEEGINPSKRVSGSIRSWQLSLAKGEGKVDPRDYDIVVPASWLKSKGIKWKHIGQEGLGSAMVGHRRGTPESKAADPMMPPGGRGFPLNARIDFEGSRATLVLQDLMEESDAIIDGRSVPLAGDFSAAISFSYYDRTKRVNKISAFLRPGEFEDMLGMYSFAPYDPDKIPLILVHGLMATAEGWLPFVNLLLADPVVREKYQIVMFNYPTGIPITASAADLRDALVSYQKVNDPRRSNPKMREMVILGHSMGGIISNMQIRDSGDRIYKTLFSTNLEDLGIEKKAEEEIRRLAYFEANPDVSRALLLAAPLRGSAFASNKIGQLGAWLIRLPFNLVDTVLGDIRMVDAMTDVGQELSQHPSNSVSSLRTDNPILHDVLASPVRPGVTIHSIMAQTDPELPKLEGTDGVVPYTSAHLDRAVSEVVVLKANHRSMVQRDETVQEVWRILRLHAGVN